MLIDRYKVDALIQNSYYDLSYRSDREAMRKALYDIPAIDGSQLVQVRHGRWICRCDFAPSMWECDACRKWCMVKGNVYRYCPSCGARMDGGEDDD